MMTPHSIMRETTLFSEDFTFFFGVACFLPIASITLYPTDEQYILFSKLAMILIVGLSGLLLRKNVSGFLFPLLTLCLCYSSLFWSVSPSQSLFGAIQLTYYTLFFVIFRSARFSHRAIFWGVRLLVGASLIIAIVGLRQRFFGYAVPPDLDQITREWIDALSGRVFSLFALPSQLAGYLLMILPLNAFLVFREKYLGIKICWGVVFFLNSAVFFSTKSFGAWLSLLCMLMAGAYLWLSRKRTITWSWLLKGTMGFLVAGGGGLYIVGLVRGQHIWDFQGNNPLWYRFLNWKTALQIFRDHPFMGTGLYTFGNIYPQYMQPGANESHYVHNTYLQFGSELGLIGILLALWFAINWSIRVLTLFRTRYQESSASPSQPKWMAIYAGFCFSLGGMGFLLHNIVDFDFYVFPLGLLGMSLLALALNILSSSLSENDASVKAFIRPKRCALYAATGLICLLVLLYIKDWQYIYAKQQKEVADSFIKDGHYHEASAHIQKALLSAPDVPEYKALEGNIFLYFNQADSAIQRYQSAIREEPETPGFHTGLAVSYLNKQNISMAYLESRRAAELFPQKERYQKHAQEIQAALETMLE